jgi:hypothetical protein
MMVARRPRGHPDGGFAAREGDLDRAAGLFQLVPDGYEDDMKDFWLVAGDPVRSAGDREAR